jgi:transposase|tara:strand:+ start:107 stop:478 length:372 start_codon:yes stop_codon:yes gene_type:complete
MRYEVMTGVERRRRWSDQEKLSILWEVGVDGETVASVARRHDVSRQQIYQWRTEMRRRGVLCDEDSLLVPVEVTEDGDSASGNGASGSLDPVEVVLTNGRSLRARATMSEAQWVRLIRIAEVA